MEVVLLLLLLVPTVMLVVWALWVGREPRTDDRRRPFSADPLNRDRRVRHGRDDVWLEPRDPFEPE